MAASTLRADELRSGRARLVGFDDQAWPVNCAAVILAAFIAGLVIGWGNFRDPRLHANGWVQLGAVGTLLALLLSAGSWLQGKMQRRLQLAVLISLLIHLTALASLQFNPLFVSFALEMPIRAYVPAADETLIAPDYYPDQIEEPDKAQGFEAPVETGVSDETAAAATVATQGAPSLVPAVALGSGPLQSPALPDVQPALSELARAESSAARQLEQFAHELTARQQTNPPELPHTEVDQPELARPGAAPRSDQVQPKVPVAPRPLESPKMAAPSEDRPPVGQGLAAMTAALQLPATIARRSAGSQTRAEGPDPTASQPSTLVKSDRGAAIPSTAMPLENEADLTPVAAGGSAGSRIPDTSSVAVQRSDATRAPVRGNTAAGGTAEFGIGSGLIVARNGIPRGRGADRPSVTPNSDDARVARASSVAAAASAAATGILPLPEMPARQGSASAKSEAFRPSGGSLVQRPRVGNPQGLASLPPTALAPDAGPLAGSMGLGRPRNLAAPVGITEPGPVGRQAEIPAGSVATGSLRPTGRAALGSALTADAGAEIPSAAKAAPAMGGLPAAAEPSPQAGARPAQSSLAGLPGAEQTATRAGATASFYDRGAPLPMAVGQRAAASQPRDGGLGIAPNTSATMVRSDGGSELPSAAVPLENAATAGAGGIGVMPGAQAGTLPAGPTATVQQSAGSGIAVAHVTVSPGMAQFGAGSARSTVLPGPVPDGGPGVPSLGGPPAAGVVGPARRPRADEEAVQLASAASFGGQPLIGRSNVGPTVEGTVSEPTQFFQRRAEARRRGRGPLDAENGYTERAVEVGLDFFSKIQFADGHWSLDQLPNGTAPAGAALGEMKSDTAATGLVLLSYLGAGYTHLDDKHRELIRRGIDWLVKHQKPDGDLFVGGANFTWLYSHGIAAMALCEAYGMTQDPELREPARKAVDFILKSQDPRHGGWRYEPGKESDTSVTGWQLMTLKSAQMAGLEVPNEALRKVGMWLDFADPQPGSGRYVYNPFNRDTPEQREGRLPSRAMTAEAMLIRMYLGRKRDDPGLIRGAEYLKANLPEVGTLEQPQRDCYYWYYATAAMFQMHGNYWLTWNNRLRPLMEASQVHEGAFAGTWNPDAPVPDRWGRHGGRIYVTAMHLLMLEVYYRHLPLFQELSK
ncbi:MAG: hypothetical protein ABSG68_01890 [Thermoguttaceae bacterium]|jgi:hypothetical protein